MTTNCPTNRAWLELTAVLDELTSAAIDLCAAARTIWAAGAVAIVHPMAGEMRMAASAHCLAVPRFVRSSHPTSVAMVRP